MSGPRGPGRVNPVLASRRVPTSGQDGQEGVPPVAHPPPAIPGVVVAEAATKLLACWAGGPHGLTHHDGDELPPASARTASRRAQVGVLSSGQGRS